MAKKRSTAKLHRGRDGLWVIRIDLPDGSRVDGRVTGDKQSVVFSHPERVPTHLKRGVIPDLAKQARIKNMTGQ